MVNTNSVLSSILFSQTIDWNIKQFFSSTSINSSFELKRIGKAITRRKDQMVVEDDKRYKRITIKTNCGGVFVRDEVLGKDIKTKKQYYVKAGQLAVSKIDARNGAFGIVPPEADGAIITGNFWVYDVTSMINYVDFADLANIMGQNYDLFEVHIVSLEWAKQIFTTLEKSRNVIMHSGELGERDIERIGINIRDWISQVGA